MDQKVIAPMQTCWKNTGETCNPDKQDRAPYVRRRIKRGDAIQPICQQARQCKRQKQPEYCTRQSQDHSLFQDEPPHLHRDRAKRHADADLALSGG